MGDRQRGNSVTNLPELQAWIDQVTELTQPDEVYWCNGSEEEYHEMADQLINKGTFIKLNEEKRPNSYYCASDPSDVARVEDRTFICSKKEEDAGNNRKLNDCVRQPSFGYKPGL